MSKCRILSKFFYIDVRRSDKYIYDFYRIYQNVSIFGLLTFLGIQKEWTSFIFMLKKFINLVLISNSDSVLLSKVCESVKLTGRHK